MTATWAVTPAGVAMYPPVALNPSRWSDFAACAFTDPEAFYPIDGANDFTVGPVQATCRRCPVRGDCLEWALDHPEDTQEGIWAGFTRTRLRKLRTARARKAVA